MSHQKATEAAVVAAKQKLEAAGEKVTIASVRQEVGGGSPDTIMAILRKIEEETLAKKYPADDQAMFRALYSTVFERGRASFREEIEGLARDLDVARIERDAARLKEAEAEGRLKVLLVRQAELQEKLQAALEDSVAAANKIVGLQEQHAREMKELRRTLERTQTGMVRLPRRARKGGNGKGVHL